MFDNKPISLLNSRSLFVSNLSIRQKYTLYRLFSNPSFLKTQPKTKPLLPLYLILVVNGNHQNNINPILQTFLSLFFFYKTYRVTKYSSTKYTNGFKDNFLKQHLINPFNTVDSWFITNIKSKISKYGDFGLLTSINSLFFVQTNQPIRNHVGLNKTVILKPLYNSSSINKYLSLDNLNSFEFQFLRKNKVYNKGRYSRCRQNYRTGVYMCMYLSVISIFGLYYWFYRFSFNFTYLWWLFIAFVGSFFLPKIVKYRLYEPITLLNSFIGFLKWLSLLARSIFFK